MATKTECLPICAPAPSDTLPVNPPTAGPPDGGGDDVNVCLAPIQFCFTSTQTGDIEHPGRRYVVDLPINPGFGITEMNVDGTAHASGLTWGPTDPDGSVFASQLQAFVANRIPGNPTVTVDNPNAGQTPCGIAAGPFRVTIACVRLDTPAPQVINFEYNGGRDLIVNPGYLTTPPTVLQGADWPYVKRSDQGGTLNCTSQASRGWETNDRGGNFELWGTNPTTNEQVTPTPRGTPVQEVAADGTADGSQATIWQTFVVPAAGTAKIKVIHGGRDPGETHTIRLSSGDTDANGTGDIINDVTNNVPPVTNLGPNPPAPWTVFERDVVLQPGTYTLSYATTSPATPVRGGLFTDMQVVLDAPDQRVDATNNDDCVVTTNETVTTTVCQFWQPKCTDGTIESWTNVATGATMDNAAFWAQVPAPSCCAGSGDGNGGGGTAAGGNLAHSYLVCGTVGGVQQTLARVVITDPSGGVLAESFVGQNGAPVQPTAWTPGDCSAAADPDEIDQYDTSPVNVCFESGDGEINRYWAYDRVRFNNRTIAEVSRVRHWFNPITGVDSTNAPVGTAVACESTLPLQVLRDVEQLGCVFDANDNIVGRVYLVETSEGGQPTGHEMMLVATDGSITRPYVGTWSNCSPNNDFVQVVESEELGCANGTPWSRRRTGFFNRDGQLLQVVTNFVDSAGNIQLATPAGFLLGDCPAPVPPQEVDLLYTSAVPVCVEEPAGVFTTWYSRSRATFNNVTIAETIANEFSIDGLNWVEATPVGILRAGVCPAAAPAPGTSNLALTCDDIGTQQWEGNSILPNTTFDDSQPHQTVEGPGWFTTMPITDAPGNDVQQHQLGVVEIEPGEIALRVGGSALGNTIVGWNDLDLEQGQTYRMTFRMNKSGASTSQWFLNNAPISPVYNDTNGTEQFEFDYTHTQPTGPYDLEFRWTSNNAALIQSLDGILFRRIIEATPDTTTPVEYSDTVRAVVDQVVRTTGCNDHVRDQLLKEILDVLGGPSQEVFNVVGTVEPGCAMGVPVTRTTTVVYDRNGVFVRSETGWSYSDGTFVTVRPAGWTLGTCAEVPRQYSTTMELVEGGVRTLPVTLPSGAVLVSWTVRQRSGTVTVVSSDGVDNTFPDTITLDAGEVISFDAGDDSNGQMSDQVVINAVNGSARVTYQYRLPT